MIYIEEPDTHGHAFGPESNEVTDVLRQLDNITNYLDVSMLFKVLLVLLLIFSLM